MDELPLEVVSGLEGEVSYAPSMGAVLGTKGVVVQKDGFALRDELAVSVEY